MHAVPAVQIVLVTHDNALHRRAADHGLDSISPQQLAKVLPGVLGGGAGAGRGRERGGGGARGTGGAAVAAVTPAAAAASRFDRAADCQGVLERSPEAAAEAAAVAAAAPEVAPAVEAVAAQQEHEESWSAVHDRELLMLVPGYQAAALGAAHPPFSQQAFAAFAGRLQQPLERVLLAAAQLLAGGWFGPAAAPGLGLGSTSSWPGAAGWQTPVQQQRPVLLVGQPQVQVTPSQGSRQPSAAPQQPRSQPRQQLPRLPQVPQLQSCPQPHPGLGAFFWEEQQLQQAAQPRVLQHAEQQRRQQQQPAWLPELMRLAEDDDLREQASYL